MDIDFKQVSVGKKILEESNEKKRINLIF